MEGRVWYCFSPITRADHPLVKYAADFTRNFDLIAERKSVIFHLRELAKASVVAKFLVDIDVPLENRWFELAAPATTPVLEDEAIVRATHYVDSASDGGFRFYIAFETEQGNLLVGDRRKGMETAGLVENPQDFDERGISAKVMRSADIRGRGFTVQDAKTFAADAGLGVGRQYAQALYDLVVPPQLPQ